MTDPDTYTQQALDDDADATDEPLPEPVCLTHLPEAALTEYWRDFAEWVLWLRRRYALTNSQLPTCWHAHAAIVEELSALHTAWLLAYHPTAPANAPLDWHSAFYYARQRIREWTQRTPACTDHQTSHDHDPTVEDPFSADIARAQPGGNK